MNNKIKYFDRLLFDKNNLYIIVGTYKKNIVISDILYLLKEIQLKTFISDNDIYYDLYPTYNIHTLLNFDIIKDIKNKQLINNNQNDYMLVIDMNNNKKILNEIFIQELLLTCKCYKISLFYTLDDLVNINLPNINKSYYIFILKENNPDKYTAIFEKYKNIFGTFKHFKYIMDNLLSSQSILIYDNEYYIFRNFMHVIPHTYIPHTY